MEQVEKKIKHIEWLNTEKLAEYAKDQFHVCLFVFTT